MSSRDIQALSLSRGDRIRTCDHLVPNQVRYRTALRPDLIGGKDTHNFASLQKNL